MIKFVIDSTGIPSANRLYEAGHYRKRQLIADVWHEIVLFAVRQQLPDVKIKAFPVHIIYHVYPPNKRRDIGNTISKVLTDGIVKAGLLPDDSLDFVRGETVWFEEVDKKHPRIEVEIVEYGS